MTEIVAPSQQAAGTSAEAPTSWATEFRATFALAWPLVIAQVAQNAINTTDVIMTGWLGPEYLAASTLASTFIMPFLVGGIGLVGAVAPLTAQARGARDIKAVRRIVRQGFWVALLTALVLVPIILQIRTILGWLGQDPVLAMRAEEYTQIAAWLLFPGLGIIVLRSLLSTFDAARVVLLVTLGGVVVNFIGNYALMFGNFGMPRLELRGAAISTVITNIAMFLALLTYVLRHRRFKRFHLLIRFWKPDWPRFRQIFRLGLPIGLTVLAEVSLFTAAAMLMGRLGTDEVAAHAVALQCASLAFMVPMGIGMATTVRVGIAYGRRDRVGISHAGWTGLALGTAFMTLSCFAFLSFGPSIVSVFLDPTKPENLNALTLAATFLVIAGIFQLVDGVQVVAAHALRGLSDAKIPMIVAIVGYWLVGLPIAYLLGLVVGWRGIGIWIGLAAGLAFVAVVLLARFALRERIGLLRQIS
ncbi:MATE family efflux transporter [Devosia riboflavina]|uniref:MATE family efflux transporter n=1 Tax=Devosia riboflavina TaxID=46914 RepID=UPI00068DAB9F|nr:MATE family efflux transporter [Devosia riboflavina]